MHTRRGENRGSGEERWVAAGRICRVYAHTPPPALTRRTAVKTRRAVAVPGPSLRPAHTPPRAALPRFLTGRCPKNRPRPALAAVSPFPISVLGVSKISICSADITPRITEACQSHSSKGGRKTLCVHSQKRSS